MLEYPELGMEAIWKIEVENFPAFIVVDDKGNDFFKVRAHEDGHVTETQPTYDYGQRAGALAALSRGRHAHARLGVFGYLFSWPQWLLIAGVMICFLNRSGRCKLPRTEAPVLTCAATQRWGDSGAHEGRSKDRDEHFRHRRDGRISLSSGSLLQLRGFPFGGGDTYM